MKMFLVLLKREGVKRTKNKRRKEEKENGNTEDLDEMCDE